MGSGDVYLNYILTVERKMTNPTIYFFRGYWSGPVVRVLMSRGWERYYITEDGIKAHEPNTPVTVGFTDLEASPTVVVDATEEILAVLPEYEALHLDKDKMPKFNMAGE